MKEAADYSRDNFKSIIVTVVFRIVQATENSPFFSAQEAADFPLKLSFS